MTYRPAPVSPGAALAIAARGVVRWVPGRGYYVRTSFAVPVSGRPRQDGGLMAVLPGGGRRQAGPGMPASDGAGLP